MPLTSQPPTAAVSKTQTLLPPQAKAKGAAKWALLLAVLAVSCCAALLLYGRVEDRAAQLLPLYEKESSREPLLSAPQTTATQRGLVAAVRTLCGEPHTLSCLVTHFYSSFSHRRPSPV
jgi:hypothetical protein